MMNLIFQLEKKEKGAKFNLIIVKSNNVRVSATFHKQGKKNKA